MVKDRANAEAMVDRFEDVARLLNEIDMPVLWNAATEVERRALVDDLLDDLWVFPDHLEVGITGAPKMNVLLSEVGLRYSGNARVGGGT
jgi:hypothetical protein